jgi:hypothetical protein
VVTRSARALHTDVIGCLHDVVGGLSPYAVDKQLLAEGITPKYVFKPLDDAAAAGAGAGDANDATTALNLSPRGHVDRQRFVEPIKQLLLKERRYWARLVLGSLLFFDTDKTTQALFSVELDSAVVFGVSEDDETLERLCGSAERDLFYDDDSERGPKIVLRLMRDGNAHADLLVGTYVCV